MIETANRLNTSGEATVTIEDGMVWITNAGSSYRQGSQMFSDAKAVLKPIINSRRYDKIGI